MQSNIITILCTISAVLAKHHHHHHHHHRSHHHLHLSDVLNTKQNFFIKTNGDIQNIMNTIFEDLEIPKEFVEQRKIKLLLTMHYDLNNIAEKNFETYDILRNITTVTVDNKAVNKIRLDEMVRKILSELQFYVHDEIEDKKQNSIQTTHATKRPLPGFNDSKEFKDFIRGFLGKVKSLTVEDLFKKKGSSQVPVSARRNLKVWSK